MLLSSNLFIYTRTFTLSSTCALSRTQLCSTRSYQQGSFMNNQTRPSHKKGLKTGYLKTLERTFERMTSDTFSLKLNYHLQPSHRVFAQTY